MVTAFSPRSETSDTVNVVGSRVSDWLWGPWYAKLWWCAIPVWWMGMAASTKMEALAPFYDSALAGFLNIAFFPLTALMVLGVGYVQHWLAGFPAGAGGVSLSDDEAAARAADLWEDHEQGMEDLRAGSDIYDPRSGPLWIGNPLSSQWPNRRF